MEDRNYSPRPLSTSREYPGYQFYALLHYERHSAGDCLRYAALTVQNWLCERIQRASGSVPEEIRCPSRADFMNLRAEDLRSCKLSFCEIITIPERGVWALTVREPDPAIAARSFVTNVGIRARDEREVEFGVYIDVIDRDPALPEQDRAYRPQFIRLLFETEGLTLRQAEPLAFRRCIEIQNQRGVARLKALANDRANQLPLVAFRQHRTDKVVGGRMNFSSDVLANFAGLLDASQEICKCRWRKRHRLTCRRSVRCCLYPCEARTGFPRGGRTAPRGSHGGGASDPV